MCTKFKVGRYLEKWPSLGILKVEKGHFTLFPAISVFSRLSEFVRFGRFKKWSMVIFSVFDEKSTQKHVSRRRNPKFSVWPLLDLVTLNDLDLECVHRKLKMILRSVPDKIDVVVLTYFHFIRLLCAAKPDTPNCQTFCLWPVTSSVTPRSATLGFPGQIFSDLSNAVWFF